MNVSVVVLCGGQGSRIKSILGNTPKVLAPVKDHVFLQYFIAWIRSSLFPLQGTITLATGIGHDLIESYVKEHQIDCQLVREEHQLGTLGAVINAIRVADLSGIILVLNGDTIFDCNFYEVYNSFISHSLDSLLVVQKALAADRYAGFRTSRGQLCLAPNNPDFISLGAFFCYSHDILAVSRSRTASSGELMMIDRDFLDKSKTMPYILPSDLSFIDIGVPKDLEKAQVLIPRLIQL